MREFVIKLKNVEMPGRHGLLPQERLTGHLFTVNLEVAIPADDFIEDPENLEKSISYADIFERVRREMERPRDLLETLAVSIADSLRKRWPRISRGRIEIVKKAPPVAGMNGDAGVEFIF